MMVRTLHGHSRRIWLAFGLVVLAKLASVGVPLVFKEILDALDQPALVRALPVAWLIAYPVLLFSNALFEELRNIVLAIVGQRSVRRTALALFRHLHALPTGFHLGKKTGEISYDLYRGSTAIRTLSRLIFFHILPSAIEIVLILGILLLKYDGTIAAVTFFTVLAYVGVTVLATESRTKSRRTLNDQEAAVEAKLMESLLNHETVKSFGNENAESARYDARLAVLEEAGWRNQVVLGAVTLLQDAIIVLGLMILMFFTTNRVVHGQMSVGDLVLTNAFLLQLYMPFRALGSIYREMKFALVDAERATGLLAEPIRLCDSPAARPLEMAGADIRFEGVHFSYAQRHRRLAGVDFCVPAGRTVAIVGPSGAGKSTVVRLLCRFYDVDAGRILVGGQDIRQVTQRSLRAAIGVVPQDTVLFNDTVLHNIAYGRPDAPAAEIVDAARLANVHEAIECLPDGYDTMVGERGLKLSAGEKQRIGIARVILKDPKIVVFDEATSALDTETEKGVQNTLRALSVSRTTLVIAHRLSTVVDADEILVLDHGRIAERGAHAELVAHGGLYAEMWALQGAAGQGH